MKAYFTTLVTLLIAMTTFTSCMDRDTVTSANLSGEWEGDFGMYYVVSDRWGRDYRYDSYCTYLSFTPVYSLANHGTGKQVDYYYSGPYERQYYSFDWQVRDGNIYLYYPYDPQLDCCIYKYSMTSSRFSGRLGCNGTDFHLRKLSDFYDWTACDGNYGCWSRNDWCYAPTRAMAADGTPEADAPEASTMPELDMTTLRRGSRFANGEE